MFSMGVRLLFKAALNGARTVSTYLRCTDNTALRCRMDFVAQNGLSGQSLIWATITKYNILIRSNLTNLQDILGGTLDQRMAQNFSSKLGSLNSHKMEYNPWRTRWERSQVRLPETFGTIWVWKSWKFQEFSYLGHLTDFFFRLHFRCSSITYM